MIADLKQRGADGIFPGHSHRKYDFRKGQSIGEKEHIIEWVKPNKPKWMSQTVYDGYPEKISVREFKVNGKVYVTTILDHKHHNKKELVELYKQRWQVEINLRSIKSVLNMDILSCKTPEMVHKELAAHMLGYNIIRIIMAEACERYESLPNKVSFKGSVQLLNQFMPKAPGKSAAKRSNIYHALLSQIVLNKVGNRPGRVEPRAVKRRQKPFPKLNNTRTVERNKIIKKIQKQRKMEMTNA